MNKQRTELLPYPPLILLPQHRPTGVSDAALLALVLGSARTPLHRTRHRRTVPS